MLIITWDAFHIHSHHCLRTETRAPDYLGYSQACNDLLQGCIMTNVRKSILILRINSELQAGGSVLDTTSRCGPYKCHHTKRNVGKPRKYDKETDFSLIIDSSLKNITEGKLSLFWAVTIYHQTTNYEVKFQRTSDRTRFSSRIWDVTGSNYDPDTGYPDWDFTRLSSVPPGKCRDSNLN
jgi:hypothetical protein